jgi:hypothetical protein
MCLDCLSTPEEQAQKIRNNEIDKMIVTDRKVDEKIVKLLLLGWFKFQVLHLANRT